MDRLATALALLFAILTSSPVWAGHEEAISKSPWGAEWFCTSEVALYVHPFLPALAVILEDFRSQDKEYILLRVYDQTLDNPVAESVHEVVENRLGPIVFFKTLPEGRILCDKLSQKNF